MDLWKRIKGFEDYMVSANGEVKSLKGGKEAILKSAELYKTGYRHVSLWKNNRQKTYTVHRLVALAFIPKPEGKTEINHKDGDRSNNAVQNIEWVTRAENMKHGFDKLGNKGGGYGKFGKDHQRAVPVKRIDLGSKEVLEVFGSCVEAIAKYPKASNLSAVCSGRRPSAGGYGWEYA